MRTASRAGGVERASRRITRSISSFEISPLSVTTSTTPWKRQLKGMLGERLPRLGQEAPQLLARLARAERLERGVAAVARVLHDLEHTPQVGLLLAAAAVEELLHLPGAGVGREARDLLVGIAGAQAAHVDLEAEPGRGDPLAERQHLVGRLQQLVVVLVRDHDPLPPALGRAGAE